MIRCDHTVACGKITRAASRETASDGKHFVSFGISVQVMGRNGETGEMSISVSTDMGFDSMNLPLGQKVIVTGTMTVRKKDGKTYFNLRSGEAVQKVEATEPDSIVADMFFRGRIGNKGIEAKTDKRGVQYQIFSAYSSDRNNGNIEFLWVNFLNFHPCNEPFLKAMSYVDIKGDLQIGVHEGNISLACKVRDIEPWQLEKQKTASYEK